MKITLKEFTNRIGQTKAAEMLGMRQGAISKAIKSGRSIYVQILNDGTVFAEETKPFPGQRRDPDHAA